MPGELELVLPDRTRVPVLGEMTIGRAPGSTLQLDDPGVSRRQARISINGNGEGEVTLEDAGSSYGTWLDGRARQRSDAAARRLADQGRQPGAGGRAPPRRVRGREDGRRTGGPSWASGDFDTHPSVRPGYALKRLEASEGPRRWVLRDLEANRFLRMSDADAELFQLVDGRHSLPELVREAEQRFGPAGPAQLARLLSELAERGLLGGSGGRCGGGPAAPRADRNGSCDRGRRPGRGPLACSTGSTGTGAGCCSRSPHSWRSRCSCLRGSRCFRISSSARYGTPFVVAQKIGIGGLVFLLGRFAVVAVHETAHGLVMVAFGRRVRKAGLKLLLVFPYAYVDTSEAWFEPRRHRIAISAAGPISDLSLGALFALFCLALPAGTVRDIFFQLAFAAYLGAFFNLNPFIERDGYQILVDLLREPGLRRRAREQLIRRLSGRGGQDDSSVLARYAVFGVAWSALAACFAVGMSLRYESRLVQVAPEPVVWGALAVVLGRLLPAGARGAGRAGARAQARQARPEVTGPEADAAAQLLERLLTDPNFREGFRRDPVATQPRRRGREPRRGDGARGRCGQGHGHTRCARVALEPRGRVHGGRPRGRAGL